jgi:hypothetical protein
MKFEDKMLADLQAFAKLYFKSNPPVVEWKEMKYSGLADNENNKIYLAPDIKHKKPWPIDVGSGLYKPRTRLKLSEHELYFQVLLHEIGHFKVKLKPPTWYYSLRKKLQKMFPDNREMQHYAAEDHIEQRESESEAEFLWRIEDFRCWLLHGYTSEEHVEVEDWSINEFKKQRGRIKKIVNNWKG